MPKEGNLKVRRLRIGDEIKLDVADSGMEISDEDKLKVFGFSFYEKSQGSRIWFGDD